MVADLVVSHPLPILSVRVLVLLPLAAVGPQPVNPTTASCSALDPDTPSVMGTKTVRRYFAAVSGARRVRSFIIPQSISARRKAVKRSRS